MMPPASPADVALGRRGFLCQLHWIDRALDRPYRNRSELERDEVVWTFNPSPRWLRPCDPGCELAPGAFRGGPLDGQRPRVPVHGPAWVRHHEAGVFYFYAQKRGTLRTYPYAGEAR